MKRKLIFNILIVLSATGGFLSCSDTWLMYDTSQKDKLYFSDGAQSLDRYLSVRPAGRIGEGAPANHIGETAGHGRRP